MQVDEILEFLLFVLTQKVTKKSRLGFSAVKLILES